MDVAHCLCGVFSPAYPTKVHLCLGGSAPSSCIYSLFSFSLCKRCSCFKCLSPLLLLIFWLRCTGVGPVVLLCSSLWIDCTRLTMKHISFWVCLESTPLQLASNLHSSLCLLPTGVRTSSDGYSSNISVLHDIQVFWNLTERECVNSETT